MRSIFSLFNYLRINYTYLRSCLQIMKHTSGVGVAYGSCVTICIISCCCCCCCCFIFTLLNIYIQGWTLVYSDFMYNLQNVNFGISYFLYFGQMFNRLGNIIYMCFKRTFKCPNIHYHWADRVSMNWGWCLKYIMCLNMPCFTSSNDS